MNQAGPAQVVEAVAPRPARYRAADRQPGTRTSTMISQTAVTGRAQAAVRRSRVAGQPRSHAAAYSITAISVTGHAAITTAPSSSHLVTLTVLRSSHTDTLSLSHDHALIAAAPA